jgi:hypothetical protein
MQKNYTELLLINTQISEEEGFVDIIHDADDKIVYEILNAEVWEPSEQSVQAILQYSNSFHKTR